MGPSRKLPGVTIAEVGIMTTLEERKIESKESQALKLKYQPLQALTCLKCQKDFWSTSNTHHRLCNPCKGRSGRGQTGCRLDGSQDVPKGEWDY